MGTELVAPRPGLSTFNCPHCSALAHARWMDLYIAQGGGVVDPPQKVRVALTACCPKRISIWVYENAEGVMAYPSNVSVPHPHPDMPQEIVPDFEEARQVFNTSPRAAAALLRLCVQKICNHLVGKPGKIDVQIGQLVAKGLPLRVQQALDSVRVIGNESVHPGTMDLNDTPEVGQVLFRLVNLIIQDCITAPKEADEIYGLLPADKIKGIEQRDKLKS